MKLPPIDLSFMLHNSSTFPDHGQPFGGDYNWTGSACTANTYTLHTRFWLPDYKVLYSRWVCAWNPQSPGDSPVIVRLVAATDGPEIVKEIASFKRDHCVTPMDDCVDITEAMQEVFDAYPVAIHIGHQTAGDGQDDVLIWQSRVELILGNR